MISVRTAHTAQLEPATLSEARSLLYAVFDDMTEDDWEHSLGGIHALAYEGGELAGHAALIQRRLLYGGRALRAGYVEGLGVRVRVPPARACLGDDGRARARDPRRL